jgi:hypothetical protein
MQRQLQINDHHVPAGELLEYLDDHRFDVLLEQGERRRLRRGQAVRSALVTLWKLDRFRMRR